MATTNLGKVSVTPKGEYDPLITYERLDIISHNGSSYIVKQALTGVTPIDGEFYALIAEKGDGGSFVKKAYKTYAAMDADKVNIPANSSVDVTNDLDESKNGAYIYDGVAFTRSQYDSKVVTDKIIADTAIAVQDAINNTAVDGGVLADTFVTMTAKANGGVARNLRDINSARFSVKDFGAVGDGVTDDRDAICKTIQACSDTGGGEVFFDPTPLGYATSYGFVDNISNVRINGNKQTLYSIDPALNTNGSISPFNIRTGNNIDIFNFIFDGQYEKWVSKGRRINSHNLAAQAVNSLRIYDNVFKDCGYPTGTQSLDEAGDSIYIIHDSNDIEVFRNTFINPSRWSLSFQYNASDIYGISIHDNVQYVTRANEILGFADLEYGSGDIATVCNNVSITRNTVYFGCMIALSNSSFKNVDISKNSFYGYTYKEKKEDRVYKDTSYPYGFGLVINFSKANRAPLSDITIADNLFDSVCKQNIEVSSPSENLNVSGNTFYTQPEAPLTTGFSKGISVKDSKKMLVSGNTIIESKFTSSVSISIVDCSGLVTNNTVTTTISTAPCTFTNSTANGVLRVINNHLESKNTSYQFQLDGDVYFSGNTTAPNTSGRITSALTYYGKNDTKLRFGDAVKATQKFYADSKLSIFYASESPTTGTHIKGDVCYNTSPADGGYVGWVCTVGGTSGTWLPFGKIGIVEPTP